MFSSGDSHVPTRRKASKKTVRAATTQASRAFLQAPPKPIVACVAPPPDLFRQLEKLRKQRQEVEGYFNVLIQDSKDTYQKYKNSVIGIDILGAALTSLVTLSAAGYQAMTGAGTSGQMAIPALRMAYEPVHIALTQLNKDSTPSAIQLATSGALKAAGKAIGVAGYVMSPSGLALDLWDADWKKFGNMFLAGDLGGLAKFPKETLKKNQDKEIKAVQEAIERQKAESLQKIDDQIQTIQRRLGEAPRGHFA